MAVVVGGFSRRIDRIEFANLAATIAASIASTLGVSTPGTPLTAQQKAFVVTEAINLTDDLLTEIEVRKNV